MKMVDREFYQRFYRLGDYAPRDIDEDAAVWVSKDVPPPDRSLARRMQRELVEALLPPGTYFTVPTQEGVLAAVIVRWFSGHEKLAQAAAAPEGDMRDMAAVQVLRLWRAPPAGQPLMQLTVFACDDPRHVVDPRSVSAPLCGHVCRARSLALRAQRGKSDTKPVGRHASTCGALRPSRRVDPAVAAAGGGMRAGCQGSPLPGFGVPGCGGGAARSFSWVPAGCLAGARSPRRPVREGARALRFGSCRRRGVPSVLD